MSLLVSIIPLSFCNKTRQFINLLPCNPVQPFWHLWCHKSYMAFLHHKTFHHHYWHLRYSLCSFISPKQDFSVLLIIAHLKWALYLYVIRTQQKHRSVLTRPGWQHLSLNHFACMITSACTNLFSHHVFQTPSPQIQ